MRLPSIKTIETRLRVDRATARKIRGAMEGYANGMCLVSSELEYINAVLGTFEVESYSPSNYMDTNWISYCNTGYTYKATVLYDGLTDRFYITSYGDFVEANEKRFADR